MLTFKDKDSIQNPMSLICQASNFIQWEERPDPKSYYLGRLMGATQFNLLDNRKEINESTHQ
jgi:hypothetical protein